MGALTPVESRQQTAGGVRLEDSSGLALLSTILVLALVGVLVAAALNGALSVVRTAGSDHHAARTFYAAEAGGEAALAHLRIAFQDGVLTDTELAAIHPPTLEGFSYDSFSVQKLGEPLVETITDGPYAGLFAYTQNVEIYSQAADPAGAMSAVVRRAKAQAIPIFQFGVLFEGDLEVTTGPPMEFSGRVHSNGNIYLSSISARLRDMITTPNKVFHDRKDFHRVYFGVYINDASGLEVSLDFDSRSTPDPEAFKAASCAKFDCRLQTEAFDVEPLRVPLPEGVPAHELVRPREDSDVEAERQAKFAWKADTYLTVDLTATKPYSANCGGGAPPETPPPQLPTLTLTRAPGVPSPSESELCTMFKWVWSAFYDGSEQNLRDALTVDMVALAAWFGGKASRTLEILYVEFIFPASISYYTTNTRSIILDATIDPTVRLINGSGLPNRMTVATEWPLYVQGDYNTTSKQPAALAADAFTVLSNAWSDEQNRPPSTVFVACESLVSVGNPCPDYEVWADLWSNQGALETTVNAAILAGHRPTPCDHEEPSCAGGYFDFYGGGIENFPRFLEGWIGIWFHYRGALISPFTSQRTFGTWNATYYSPPMPDWSFDTDFRDPALLPPATPNIGNVLRTAAREAF